MISKEGWLEGRTLSIERWVQCYWREMYEGSVEGKTRSMDWWVEGKIRSYYDKKK